MLKRIFDTFIPARVILSAAWDAPDVDLLDQTMQRLKSLGLRVTVIGSGIRLEANIQPLIYQSGRVSVREVERFEHS